MPSTRRTSDPVRTGVPTKRPNSNSFSPSSCLIEMPMIEKIVQTAKQTVNATVDSESARLAPGAGQFCGSGEVIHLSIWTGQKGPLVPKQKRRQPDKLTAQWTDIFQVGDVANVSAPAIGRVIGLRRSAWKRCCTKHARVSTSGKRFKNQLVG